jgi:hypothetical protein
MDRRRLGVERMTIAELKKAKDERPFTPFTIEMADGRKIQVKHPDAVACSEGSRPIRRPPGCSVSFSVTAGGLNSGRQSQSAGWK